MMKTVELILLRKKKGKKKKHDVDEEGIDFTDNFADDNKEDRLISSEVDNDNLSAAGKEMKKMVRKNKGENEEDDDFDFEDSEEEALQKLVEEPKEKPEPKGKKRKSSAPKGSATKKQRTEPGPAIATGGLSEKDFEKKFRDLLMVRGKMLLSDLIKEFRPDIAAIGQDGKDVFKKFVFKLCEATTLDKKTYVVLKDDQYKHLR